MLFKYFPFVDEQRLRGHLSGDLWFSNIDFLNDPFEGEVYIDEERSFKQLSGLYAIKNKVNRKESDLFVCRLIESNQLSLERNHENLIRSVKKRTFSTSFSSVNNSILMWSHYSNDHTGYVIGYDFPSDNFNMLSLMGVTEPGYSLKEVEYNNERHTLSDTIAGFDYPLGLYRKAKDWSYENEVRTVFTKYKSCESAGILMNINRGYVKSIFFGIRSDLNKYQHIVNDFNMVKSFQMKPTSKKYELYPILIR